VLAVAYALTDEFHQSFVPGRHASFIDALGFDAGGAGFVLLLTALLTRRKAR
jgi:VanZ family protein